MVFPTLDYFPEFLPENTTCGGVFIQIAVSLPLPVFLSSWGMSELNEIILHHLPFRI